MVRARMCGTRRQQMTGKFPDMKRILSIFALMLVSLCCFAQAQVTIVSKKDKISDFPVKTLKVVLPGENFVSLSLRESVKNTWNISPYEFCDNAEFERLKNDPGYYFMLIIRSSGTVNEGISYVTVVKGGADKIEDMLELVTLPLCSSDLQDGRENVFMSAILDVAQAYIESSVLDGFKKVGSMVKKMPADCSFVVDAREVSERLDQAYVNENLGGVILTEEEILSIMENGTSGKAVGYSIAPAFPQKGNVCWKMVFNARTHELYYLKKSKIGARLETGFTKSDFARFINQ